MQRKLTKGLSAHLTPKPLAVRDFWRKWTVCCQRSFSDSAAELSVIERLGADIDTKSMFVQLDEGLEQLLLTGRGGNAIALTPNAWLALTWIVLHAFTSEHSRNTANEARKKQARIAACAALEKARTLFILSNGQAIAGVSIQDWIDKGPWSTNALSWALLFQHGLHLVHPRTEPLYWALRQRWVEQTQTEPTRMQALDSMTMPHDATAWCLPRAITLANTQNVLRSGRRWALRAQNSMHDTTAACEFAPEWQGVYLFSIWLNREENEIDSTPQEMALLRGCMTPENLAYWLVLCHDCRHHPRQHRNLQDAFNLQDDRHYSGASNMLMGLQIFSPLSEIELALAAWTIWTQQQTEETLPLPNLV